MLQGDAWILLGCFRQLERPRLEPVWADHEAVAPEVRHTGSSPVFLVGLFTVAGDRVGMVDTPHALAGSRSPGLATEFREKFGLQLLKPDVAIPAFGWRAAMDL